jgi:hypothetical protein
LQLPKLRNFFYFLAARVMKAGLPRLNGYNAKDAREKI